MPSINPPPIQPDMPLANWFMQVFRICFDVQRSGTTAQRPTDNIYIGKPYYDLTLGYEIHVHAEGPPVVWHNGAGAAV